MNGFAALIGNDRLKAQLQKALEDGHTSHAYLLVGGEGTGKKTLAMLFAQALRCTGWGEAPCGVCANCQDFANGKFHPDVVFLRPGKNTKGEDKKSIGVEEVRRQVVAPAMIRPDGPGKKVFILEQGELLTIQAQNALLKSLEEPPDYAVFLILSETVDAILPTVRSRMVLLQMETLPQGTIARELSLRLGLTEGEALHIAALSQGSLGRALTLAASEAFAAMSEAVHRWLRIIQTEDMLTVMGLAEEMKAYQNRPEFLDLFTLRYRDILVTLTVSRQDLLLDKARAAEIAEDAAGETVAAVFAKLDAVQEAKKQLAANGNFILTMEMMLRKLKESLALKERI